MADYFKDDAITVISNLTEYGPTPTVNKLNIQ